MTKIFSDHLDGSTWLPELRNLLFHKLGSAPTVVEGRGFYNTATKTLGFQTDSTTIVLGRLDQISAPTADVSLNSHKITSLSSGTATTDAVNLGQLQDAIAGLNWKDSVRVATTANGTLASAFENGDTVDGVTLATGDRILVKDQSSGADNGIYTVNASGAPTRATDADSATDIRAATVYVEEGSTNAGSLWTLATDPPITLGSTSLTFAQFGGGSSYSAGAGIGLTGSTFSVAAGTGLTQDADGLSLTTPVSVANGGTNATDAATARSNLGIVSKFAATIGDGSTNPISVTHSLGTRDVFVSVHDATTFEEIGCGVTKTSTSAISLAFTTAPATNSLRVTVLG